MRKVCRLAREVLDAAAREVKPGATTDYIDEVVHRACLERDVRFHFLASSRFLEDDQCSRC
jgi:methionine aminopeptidase